MKIIISCNPDWVELRGTISIIRVEMPSQNHLPSNREYSHDSPNSDQFIALSSSEALSVTHLMKL